MNESAELKTLFYVTSSRAAIVRLGWMNIGLIWIVAGAGIGWELAPMWPTGLRVMLAAAGLVPGALTYSRAASRVECGGGTLRIETALRVHTIMVDDIRSVELRKKGSTNSVDLVCRRHVGRPVKVFMQCIIGSHVEAGMAEKDVRAGLVAAGIRLEGAGG